MVPRIYGGKGSAKNGTLVRRKETPYGRTPESQSIYTKHEVALGRDLVATPSPPRNDDELVGLSLQRGTL